MSSGERTMIGLTKSNYINIFLLADKLKSHISKVIAKSLADQGACPFSCPELDSSMWQGSWCQIHEKYTVMGVRASFSSLTQKC